MADEEAYTDPPIQADVAATIDGYDTPLPLAALASPYALDSISDTDLHGTPLTSDGTTVVDSTATVVQSQLGGPASSLSAYPLATTDLAADAVTAAKIAANAVANSHLQNDAVDTAEIVTDAVTSALIASGAVDQAHLSFDAATQTELNNHAGDATAHHSKPTSTQSESIGGGYHTPTILASSTWGTNGASATVADDASATWATANDASDYIRYDTDNSVDGFRIYTNNQSSTWTAKLLDDQNNVLDSFTFGNSSQWTHYNFSAVGERVEITADSGDGNLFEIDLHEVHLPAHAHSI